MKPPEIIELEKEFGFEFEVTNRLDDFWSKRNSFFLNKENKIIGLDLERNFFKDIPTLEKFKNLEIFDINTL